MTLRRPSLFDEKKRFMLLLIAPAVLVLVFFQILPILTGANASFRDWYLHDPKKTWVGLNHYAYVLTDAGFLRHRAAQHVRVHGRQRRAARWSLGLLLALLLNRQFPGRWLVQTIILLPLMVAPVVAAIMIRWMFNDQFGIVNVVLDAFGIPPIAWLAQRWTAFARHPVDRYVAVDAVVRAAAAGRPAEPAARAVRGGADRRRVSAWRMFRYLTLPMLRPVIVVCVVIRAIDAFRTFDIVWTISAGGPGALDRGVQHLRLYRGVPVHELRRAARPPP